MKSTHNFIIIIFLCLFFFFLGVLAEKIIFKDIFAEKKEKSEDTFRSLSGDHKFTNPLLDCEPNISYISPKIETVLKERVAFHKKNALIEEVSVYFRHLNNGAWYGVNEREKFIPASLNKVPLMIAALRLTEEYPEVLNYKFVFDEMSDSFIEVEDASKLTKEERVFNIFDIVEYMIKYSHNETAGFIINLLESFNKNFLNNVFLDLGMSPPNNKELHQLSTKEFASFFRVLYNSTYLSNKNSEMALFFLSESEFKDGIYKGVDDNIIISHKFGQINDDKLSQLHDCGIVYFPGDNYILCVMVKGYDIPQMSLVIQDISKSVYQEVKRQVAEQE